MTLRCNFRLTIVRHGENRNLGNGAVTALDTTGTLVHGGQISVHVTRVTTTTRNLLTGGGHLTKSITVGRQIGKNDEDVLLELVGVVLGGCKGKTRGDNTFDAALAVSRYFICCKISPTYVGSLAKLVNIVTRSIDPFSSKSLVKKRAVSKFTPMAPKTMEKLSSCISCTPLPLC
jgi:hypothetical protein